MAETLHYEVPASIPDSGAPTPSDSEQAAHPTVEPPGGRKPRTSGQRLSPRRIAVLLGVIGIVLTASLSWTARDLDRNDEHRLLEVQTRQAAGVIGLAILGISNPLTTAQQIASATGGSPQEFARFMSLYAGPGRLFVSASLWRTDGDTPRAVAAIGLPPLLLPTSIEAQQVVTRALHSKTFVVIGIPPGFPQRIGYAMASPAEPTFVVYAERAIPANRTVPVEANSAFADLNYVTYLGRNTNDADVATTDLPLSRVPLSGDTAREYIPFGDSTITLVASPRMHLGGSLGARLPWILLVGGALLTLATAFVAELLVKRRREAEQSARTITGLYETLDDLFAEQRTIAETLQRALLPQVNPTIPELEIASRYVAGAAGVDIGGDWYSLVALDRPRFAFVVGDVSGRGIGAASVMARLRFTIRAYLLEGHSPEAVLGMCSRQLDIAQDAHFATVLVGIGDLGSRAITIANAGHLNPLLISASGSEFVTTDVGPPLGVGPIAYAPTTFAMPADSTLVVFTDGLIERRGEHIDLGLHRLAEAATAPDETVEHLLTGLLSHVAGDGSEDDIAILAFRWVGRAVEQPTAP